MLLARSAPAARRGVILLVTITLIALFAVIALSFALYGESQATALRTYRESIATSDDPPDAAPFASQFLGRVLYPVDPQNVPYGTDDGALLNAIRGYDMATMVYGNNPTTYLANLVPYNGVGTVQEDLRNAGTNAAAALAIPVGITDRRQVVNYSWQFDRTAAANHRVFDPEFLGLRAAKGTAPPATATYVARNAPYTYADRNNLYVAVLDPATGRIVKVSYVSPHFNGGPLTAIDPPLAAPDTAAPRPELRLAPPFTQAGIPATGNNGIRNAANDDWLNPQGRYKTIRPRPTDHVLPGETVVDSQFPYIPANPDGTYTGDVQNFPNTDGVQKNDAVWINVGLPVLQWRGKTMVPLVAPTILPLDGRVNANVAGLGSAGASHSSTHGFGPWEIGLSQLFPNDAANMITARNGGTGTTPTPPGLSGTFQYSFLNGSSTPANSPQAYGLVDWNGNAQQKPYMPGDTTDPETPMGGSLLKSNVTYPHTATPFTLTQYGESTEPTTHPGSFNPYSWAGLGGRLLPFTDLRRSAITYSARSAASYQAPFYGNSPTNDLTGTGPGSTANRGRTLLTTISNSVARAGLLPAYRDYLSATRTVEYSGGQLSVNYNYATPAVADADRVLQAPFAVQPTGASSAVWVSDYTGGTTTVDRYRATVAANLGALNVNRPLADYRANTTLSLADPANAGATMLALKPQADADRVQLAREIFGRLILAVGAKAQVTAPISNATSIILPVPAMMAGSYTLTPLGGTPVTVTQAEYDALRYLAQIAINMVEYVDNDDIITAFQWNPNDANDIVYGVEKTRLVINEVYSEMTNDPTNQSGPFQVKFWVELLNTSNNDVAGSPLAGVPGPAMSPAPAGNIPLQITSGMTPATGTYRIEVYKQGSTAVTNMAGNALGDAAGMTPPDIQLDTVSLTGTTASAQYVEPNNGGLAAVATGRNGLAVVGPKPPATPPTNGYNPTNPTIIVGNGTAKTDLFYTEPFAQMAPANNKNQTVLLRRLLNPYVPADPTTNPYITVDYMTNVYSEDGIQNVQNMAANPPTIMNPSTTQIQDRMSIGRVQPYLGREVLGMTPSRVATYPTSHVVPQRNTAAMAMAPQPKLSLFQHNSSVDLTTTGTVPNPDPQQQLLPPFEWLVHPDRPVVNQLELLHVAGCRNHDVTHSFSTPVAMGNPTFHQHTAFQSTLNGTGSALNAGPPAMGRITDPAPLYRVLELLTARPWGYGLPAGGRVPGKINVNMIWDPAVLNALADLNTTTPSNSFQAADVNTFYTSLLFGGTVARTKDGTNRIPAATADEADAPASGADTRDRPFKPFGVASFAPPQATPVPPTLTLYPNGSGVQDTLLRDANPTTPTGPAAYNLASAGPPAPPTHPYQKLELLRKMYNNLTTTSDTYLVVMTVGYFEVRGGSNVDTANPVVLGRELFVDVPGDMRKKYVAVVDRSMIGVTDPVGNSTVMPVVPPDMTQPSNVWESDVVRYAGNGVTMPVPQYLLQFHAAGASRDGNNNVTALQLVYEGRTFTVSPGSTLVIGTGANAEKLTVQASQRAMPAATNILGGDANGDGDAEINGFDPNTGIATVMVTPTIPAAVPKAHAGGERLANWFHGNPGPQPDFDVNLPKFKGVVPFFEAVTTGR